MARPRKDRELELRIKHWPILFHGVEFMLPWYDLPRWGSFFIPTIVTVEQALPEILPQAQLMNYEIEVRRRCENGVLGLRVWRTY